MDDPKTDEINELEGGSKRSGRRALIGIVFLLIGVSGGFASSYAGLIPAFQTGQSEDTSAGPDGTEMFADVAFVPIEPLIISLLDKGEPRHLRFRAKLEVPKGYEKDVTVVLPRIVDVLNGYLRALDYADIAQPSSLIRFRAQMLRRITSVVGPDRVNDLLIMEFVLT